jgi:3-phenylpropionate/trans-cinnamate dioxygenase ferredoxin reductase subunit
MEDFKYVVIGGGLAGGRACQGIRRLDTEGSIAVVTGETHVPYHRPPLSKGYLTGKEDLGHVYVKPDAYYAEQGVDLIKGTLATEVNPATWQVTLEDGRVLTYGKLLLATGGRAWRLPIPGNDLERVLTLRTLADADAVRQAAQSSARALVLGGSFIGSEVAASLAQLGVHVPMVFPESRMLERVVPEELSHFLQLKYEAAGVHILPETKPESLNGEGWVEWAILDNGEALKTDLVVMGVGIQLNTELAEGAGLEMDVKGGVIVDPYLRTSDPKIYAAGDIAAWPDPTFGKRLRVEHWDVAWRQGMRAGRNMAGEHKPYQTLPYFFSDLFDLSFEVWGDLTTWDQTVRRGKLESGSYAFYYFHQGRMVGVLAVNRPDEERDPMVALVKSRPTYSDVGIRLADEATDLSTLVE